MYHWTHDSSSASFFLLPAFPLRPLILFLKRQMLSIRHGTLAVSGSVMRIGELHSASIRTQAKERGQ